MTLYDFHDNRCVPLADIHCGETHYEENVCSVDSCFCCPFLFLDRSFQQNMDIFVLFTFKVAFSILNILSFNLYQGNYYIPYFVVLIFGIEVVFAIL